MHLNTNSQSGNVLFIILIAVVLFAALSYVVATMMRGGSDMGNEKFGIYASEVLTYARSVSEAVQTVRISNGCENDEVSFERSPFDGSDATYDNPNSPADFSCHVFHSNGGGISQSEMDDDIFNSAYSGDSNYGKWMISGYNVITGLGSNSNSELVLVLPFVRKALCNIITARIGQASTIADDVSGVDITEFTGIYSAAATYNGVDNTSQGCINITGGANPLHYTLFTTLIAR